MAIPLLVLLAVGAGAAFAASGCGGDGGPDDLDDLDTDAGTDRTVDPDTGTDADADVGTDADSDVVDTNPCDDDPGINHCFYHCDYFGEDGSVVDIDINSSNILKGMTDYSINRKFAGSVDPTDPLGFATPFSANFGMSDFNAIGLTYNGSQVRPVQIHEIHDGVDFVPFRYQGDVDSATYDLSGVAFINGESSPEIQSIDPVSIDGAMTIHINGIQGAVVFEIADGTNAGTYLGVAANEVKSNNGRFLYYGYNQSAASLNQSDSNFFIYTSGRNAFAVEMLDDGSVLVANAEGGPQSWQVHDSASLDIIDMTVADPADAVVATIPFPADVTLIPFPELALSDDKSHAIVAGGPGSNQTTVYVVDLAANSVVGAVDLSEVGIGIGGLDVRGNQIAVSMNGSEFRDDSDGTVLIVDFSDPSNPFIDLTVRDVGYGMGAVALHESGTVYVAAKAAAYEIPPTDMANKPYKRIVAIDPSVAGSH